MKPKEAVNRFIIVLFENAWIILSTTLKDIKNENDKYSISLI